MPLGKMGAVLAAAEYGPVALYTSVSLWRAVRSQCGLLESRHWESDSLTVLAPPLTLA